MYNNKKTFWEQDVDESAGAYAAGMVLTIVPIMVILFWLWMASPM